MLRQEFQQLKFPVWKFDLLRPLVYFPALCKNPQLPCDNGILRRAGRFQQTVITPEMCLDPGNQLLRFKGLGNIVVSPQAKPADFIRQAPMGADHQNRNFHFIADPPANLVTAAAWQHQIQQDQIVLAG